MAVCAQRWIRSLALVGRELRLLVGGAGADVLALALAR